MKLKQKQKLLLAVLMLGAFWLSSPKARAFEIKLPMTHRPFIYVNQDDPRYKFAVNPVIALMTDNAKQKFTQAQAARKTKLAGKVADYLQAQNSPLANYAFDLISIQNWKQIVALSNAESGMCKNYPIITANCWGVGGAKLWHMGENLGEGIQSMNDFLAQYPRNSKVKYAQMTFKQMNGLYKQPPAAHWVFNAQKIYDDLSILESGL